jgi:serine O-acetyltransferase
MEHTVAIRNSVSRADEAAPRARQSAGDVWRDARRDLDRYFRLDADGARPAALERLRIVVDTPGLHAVLVYRFGLWAAAMPAPVRMPLKLAYYLLHKLCVIGWGIHIDARARIGGGLYIGHFGGVVIGPVVMGRDCNVAHQVTIGRHAASGPGVPTLGDRVWIGTGSLVYGDIRVGSGTTIGPLTVVSRTLPAKVLVGGNPMRILQHDYDNSVAIGDHAGVSQPGAAA